MWAKSLGNMFGSGRQSFREHLAEGRAAVASWQVDLKKEGLPKESCEKGEPTIGISTMCNSSSLVLAQRNDAFDSVCWLMQQLDQLNVRDTFAAMLKNKVRTSSPCCGHAVQSHNVHHALTKISRFKGYLHDDDLNLAALTACRLCFLRYLPVIDGGKDTDD